jgi:hypothetical protein
MKQTLNAVCTVLALILGMAGTAEAASPPRARLRHLVCQHDLDPAARAVSVTAVMRPLPGTVKLALRFELLSRPRGASSFSALGGGDLGSWIEPGTPTLGRRRGDVWLVNKQVVDLAAPAAYRFRVSFRWTGKHGRVLGTAVRRTPTCFQPELRPDLLVRLDAVKPVAGNPQLSEYFATIRNDGATAAGRFDVRFSPAGGGPVTTTAIDGMAAHSRQPVRFVGPACSPTTSGPTTITVDPTGEVDDANRANKAVTIACPAAPASASRGARSGR